MHVIKIIIWAMLFAAASGCGGMRHATQPPADALSDHAIKTQQADAAYIGGDWGRAEQIYTVLVGYPQQHAIYWLRLGNIYAHTSRHSAAIHAYYKALALDPADIKTWNNLGVVQLREAMHTFITMQQYIARDDPLYGWVDDILKATQDALKAHAHITSKEK